MSDFLRALPGKGPCCSSKPMTTRDIPRNERAPGEQPAQATGATRGTTHSRATQSARRWARRVLLPLSDTFALTLAALLAARHWPTAGYVVAVLVFLRVSGQHRLRICLRVSDEVPRLAVASIVAIPLLLPWDGAAGPLLFLGVTTFGFLVTARFSLYTLLRAANRRKWLTEPALIVGTSELGLEIGELLLEHAELGLHPIGFVDNGPATLKSSLPLLGEVSDISAVVSRHDVRRIIVSPTADDDASLVSALRADEQLTAEVCVVPRMRELAAAVPANYPDDVWGIPLVPLRKCGLRRSGRALKRSFDLVVGTFLLAVLSPLLLLLMGAVLLSCGRPVLFRQTRITRSGHTMKIAKLRTVAGAEREGHWTVSPDECSTLSRWLRATHLDELPQLLNVIRGEMSLTGPRPERPYFASRFAKIVPRYEDRHRTSAGMTGWAQVHGLTGDTSIPERVRFDNNYIEHWSLWLDIVILTRTLAEPLAGIRSKYPGRRVERSTNGDQPPPPPTLNDDQPFIAN
jgi:exopolysaccharide biosynthesis polyprenyl glycosylphosphotransferase